MYARGDQPADRGRIDLLLTYALAVAARQEAVPALGAIHLVKCVYLADVAFAERRHGRTFTGVRWVFSKYGPWSDDVHARIARVVRKVGALETAREGRFEGDAVGWRAPEGAPFDEVDAEVPPEVCVALEHVLRTLGDDTAALLQHVYATWPMRRTAPNEAISFATGRIAGASGVEEEVAEYAAVPRPALSPKEKKRRRARVVALRERFRRALAAPTDEKLVDPVPPPRYDAVFEDGMRGLDDLAGAAPERVGGEAILREDVWTSGARKRGPLP